MTAFREAANENDVRGQANLGVGYTQQAQGDRDAALATFRQIASQTTSNDQALNHARALQAVGNILEIARRWDEARAAWEEFVSYVQAHPDVGSSANGRARVEAIQRRAELDRSYEVVRTRIAERRRVNATGPTPQQQP